MNTYINNILNIYRYFTLYCYTPKTKRNQATLLFFKQIQILLFYIYNLKFV